MCQRAWIDFDYLLNVALEGDYASYLKAMNDQFGINHRRIMEVTSESVKKYVDRGVFRDEDFAVQQYLNTVTNNLDAIYTFTNSKHFIYRSDCYDVIAMLKHLILLYVTLHTLYHPTLKYHVSVTDLPA